MKMENEKPHSRLPVPADEQELQIAVAEAPKENRPEFVCPGRWKQFETPLSDQEGFPCKPMRYPSETRQAAKQCRFP